jgi:hypothetical protein
MYTRTFQHNKCLKLRPLDRLPDLRKVVREGVACISHARTILDRLPAMKCCA